MVSTYQSMGRSSHHPCQQALAAKVTQEIEVYITVAPLLSLSVAQPPGHRANRVERQGQRVYTIGAERRVYTVDIAASDLEKGQKKGFYGGDL